MRHKNKQGIAYSIVPFGSSRQMFLVGEPEGRFCCADAHFRGKTVPDYSAQVRNLLENVKAVCEKERFTDNIAGMCHFFIADIGMKELVRQLANEILPHFFGAATFVPQKPASGVGVALELWVVGGTAQVSTCSCEFDDYDEMEYCDCEIRPFDVSVVTEFDGMRWFFAGDASPDYASIGSYERSRDAFELLADWLECEDFRLAQVFRTWIYQGHLVMEERHVPNDGCETDDGVVSQRYKELNRARTDFFGDTKFLKKYLPKKHKGTVYPASTGIGADDFDVVISAVALDTKRKDVIVCPLENPNQTSAFDYGAVYSPQSPKFSRAMAVAVANECMIFVSGTASIIDSESQHIEDPVKQTELTLDNIAALIDGQNLARHGISGFSCGLGNLECVRVYVKRPAELELIRQVCERRLSKVPTLYTIADVCRPELLVEIEGIAMTRKS